METRHATGLMMGFSVECVLVGDLASLVVLRDEAPGGSRRRRRAVALFLLFAAPVFAELLASYLSGTGDALAGLGLIAFLAPLYGGAGILIREVSVRTGRGWRARLLLATAFGVAMPTLVDASLFAPENADVDNWETIMQTTAIGGSGISAYGLVTWVAGHVVMSICAPLAVAEGLAAGERRRPWLSAKPLTALALLGLAIALLIRFDDPTGNPSSTQTLVSAGVVVALLAAALGPWDRPRPPATDSAIARPLVAGAVGFTLMLAFDLAPISWLGVAVELCAATAAWVFVDRRARSTRWGWRHIAALGYGAILARAVIGFLVPVPIDVEPVAKYTQNALLLALVITLGLILRSSLKAPANIDEPLAGRGSDIARAPYSSSHPAALQDQPVPDQI